MGLPIVFILLMVDSESSPPERATDLALSVVYANQYLLLKTWKLGFFQQDERRTIKGEMILIVF